MSSYRPDLTTPERIEALRGKLSHDKFAALLGPRATRQMVIRWEKGEALPSKAYAERLAELSGGQPEDFRPPELVRRGAAAARLDRIEERISALEEGQEEVLKRLRRRAARGSQTARAQDS